MTILLAMKQLAAELRNYIYGLAPLLLALPKDIRLRIYHHVFVNTVILNSSNIPHEYRSWCSWPSTPGVFARLQESYPTQPRCFALIQTCHKIRKEAFPVLAQNLVLAYRSSLFAKSTSVIISQEANAFGWLMRCFLFYAGEQSMPLSRMIMVPTFTYIT